MPFLVILSVFFNILKDIVNRFLTSSRAGCFENSKKFIIIQI